MLWHTPTHAATLQAQWQALGVALQHDSPAWQHEGRRLLQSWSRWPRAYHDTTHLHACLQHLHTVQRDLPEVLQNPAAVGLALWFHDAVYWPWRTLNEERSADWATRFLRAQTLPPTFVDTVHQHILDTRHTPGPLTGDAQWVVDIDLAVLGQDAAVYGQFERNVRREYFFVRRSRYVAGRSAVLQSFLDRPRIYGTDWFADRYEAAARHNLTLALAALHGGRSSTLP
ncbi:MAG: HD domain-containing protein [Giesbergeria sp.]